MIEDERKLEKIEKESLTLLFWRKSEHEKISWSLVVKFCKRIKLTLFESLLKKKKHEKITYRIGYMLMCKLKWRKLNWTRSWNHWNSQKALGSNLKTFLGFPRESRGLWFAFYLVASKSIVILGQEKLSAKCHLREFSTS